MTKDSLTPLIERIRVQEEKLADVKYDIETVRDVQLKTEKVIEANHQEVKNELEAIKARLHGLEDIINALKK